MNLGFGAEDGATSYSLGNSPNPGFTYTRDSIDRPTTLTQSSTTWVQNAAYGPSNELPSIQIASPFSGTTDTETRTCNNRLELLNLKVLNAGGTKLMNLTYAFPDGTNNSQANGVNDRYRASRSPGITISSITCDGFWILLTKGSYNGLPATNMSLACNAMYNHVANPSGFNYDSTAI